MSLDRPLALDEIRAARTATSSVLLRAPLIRLDVGAPVQIWLKLENLQPTGSFKVRGAGAALRAVDRSLLTKGVWTASAGNMALALAWWSRRLGLQAAVVAPDDAPEAKLAGVRRLGARIFQLPFARYQQIQREACWEEVGGLLIHPFADRNVMAGNAVIGVEILEELPDVDAIIAPYGGGGLSCGIAAAARALGSAAQVYGCEVETGAPLCASLAAGHPVTVPYAPSFVSGMGAPFVFEQMWPLAARLLAGAPVVTLAEVKGAIRLLAEHAKVVAEGAAATTVAAALKGACGRGKVVCVISGGNIGPSVLAEILAGAS
jgi:threonine dehydratase